VSSESPETTRLCRLVQPRGKRKTLLPCNHKGGRRREGKLALGTRRGRERQVTQHRRKKSWCLGVARRVGGGGRATGIRIPDLELAARFDGRKDVVYDGVMQRSIEQP
jgi:hypothetical protein